MKLYSTHSHDLVGQDSNRVPEGHAKIPDCLGKTDHSNVCSFTVKFDSIVMKVRVCGETAIGDKTGFHRFSHI